MDPFFHDTYDCTGTRSISPDAKILIALKVLAYGCAGNCWKDYFQMCEDMALKCAEHLIKAVSQNGFFAINI